MKGLEGAGDTVGNVDFPELSDQPFVIEDLKNLVSSGGNDLPPQGVISEKAVHVLGKSFWIVCGTEHSGPAMLHQFGNA